MWWNCFSEVALVLGDHLGILSVRIHEKLSKVECKHFSHWSYFRSCILRLDQGLKSLIQSISYRSFPLCHNKKTTLYALSDLLSDWYVIPVGRSGKAIRGFLWHLRGSGWQLPEIDIERGDHGKKCNSLSSSGKTDLGSVWPINIVFAV